NQTEISPSQPEGNKKSKPDPVRPYPAMVFMDRAATPLAANQNRVDHEDYLRPDSGDRKLLPNYSGKAECVNWEAVPFSTWSRRDRRQAQGLEARDAMAHALADQRGLED